MKKVGVLLILVITITAGVVFAWQAKSQGRVSEVLSERSQEFLEGQAGKQDSEWSGMEFDGSDTPDTRNTVFNVDDCFSFMMLYRIFNQRIQGECSGYYAFNDPKGSIVTYIREASNISSVDSAEGVSFRRLSPEKYQETTKQIGGKEFLIFKNLEEPYEAIAYHYYTSQNGTGGYYLAFVLKATTLENLDSDLEKMLSSIEIFKE